MKYLQFNKEQQEYLCKKDKRMAWAIEQIGSIKRPCDIDLFSSIVRHIIGQQISSKALVTVWTRLKNKFGRINAKNIASSTIEELQSLGMTYRKAGYIKDFAIKVYRKEFNLSDIEFMDDKEAIDKLSSLHGIGVWTAEMILLFCLNRLNIFSFNDLAIQRGLRLLYKHKTITHKIFEKYRKRFSPYCSLASLYLWEIAGGAISELQDTSVKTKKLNRK